jgi:hypothetical protein
MIKISFALPPEWDEIPIYLKSIFEYITVFIIERKDILLLSQSVLTTETMGGRNNTK